MTIIRHLLRHPRTTQERRRWYADADDVDLRRRRSPPLLPTLWDDTWRGAMKNWKEYRRSRWRRIAAK